VIPDPIDIGDDIVDAVDWNGVLGLWLQPMATVLTGLFALVAAIVAYRAVTRQIKANAENVQKQIDAAAAEAQKNRATDWAKMRRQEVLDLVLEAGNIARRLESIGHSYSTYEGVDPEEESRLDAAFNEFTELNAPDHLPLVMANLKMHGLTALAEAVSRLEIEVGAIMQDIEVGGYTVHAKRQAVSDEITKVLEDPDVVS
jgi:hypothetical protein